MGCRGPLQAVESADYGFAWHLPRRLTTSFSGSGSGGRHILHELICLLAFRSAGLVSSERPQEYVFFKTPTNEQETNNRE